MAYNKCVMYFADSQTELETVSLNNNTAFLSVLETATAAGVALPYKLQR